MADPLRRTFNWTFDSPPEAIWPILSDTARFNEAARLPKQEIEEFAQPDGSVRYMARARKGPFRLVWREKPVNWVYEAWFEHCRYFQRGPLASLCATFRLFSDGAGARGEYTIEAAPANLLGRLILLLGFFQAAGRTFGALARDADAFAAGRRATPFSYEAPALPERARTAARAIADRLGRAHPPPAVERLVELVLSAQEVDLVHLRPLQYARDWGLSDRAAIELFLDATKAGLLDLRWDLLCPRCRIAKDSVVKLDALPTGAHCGTCNIDYDREFSRNVELSFHPAAAIRPIEAGEYCLFGPMSTPHIRIHLTLAAGETRTVNTQLAAGRYRLRTLEPGPEMELDWCGGGFPAMIARDAAVETGTVAPPGTVELRNETGRELTLIVEEKAWVRDALTADRVTALQAFRDLFADEVLRPGDDVGVSRVALMFTDLKGSTALYGRIGDAGAYRVVRDHFAFLTAAVRRHDGAVVKTIGDAIMAAFARPSDALAAALQVQETVARFNQEHGDTAVVIKLGIHAGPCISVTLNDRLDYFGTTVNLAARLQSESVGGDIVLSADMVADGEVAALLEGRRHHAESAVLKGIDEPAGFVRVEPGKS